MRYFNKYCIFFIQVPALIAVTGCASPYESLKVEANDIATQANFQQKLVHEGRYDILTYYKLKAPNLNKAHIYIEGDGYAWANKNLPSGNPTPKNHLVLKLAALDSFPNVIYVARPCQYVTSPLCNISDWTTSRFSTNKVRTIATAINSYNIKNIDLIGYSGGAAIAVALPDYVSGIDSIITMAGNLDHKKFSEYHNVDIMDGADTTAIALQKIKNIPQIHYTGENDTTIPPALTRGMLTNIKDSPCVKITEIKSATHSEGWETIWPELLKQQPSCS